jgi:hypothetical protein
MEDFNSEDEGDTFPATSVTAYNITRRHKPEDHNRYNLGCGLLGSDAVWS